MDGLHRGHAHDEVMEGFSTYDILVLAVIFVVVLGLGYYLFKQIQKLFLSYLRNEIKNEVYATVIRSRPVSVHK